MTAEHALAFVLFAVVAAITPGPSNLLQTSTGAAVGIVRGLPALLGQVLGMGLLMFLVALGLGSLVLTSPFSITALKWGGSVWLLWLAWTITTAGPQDAPEDRRVRLRFGQAAAFQWVNPKAWLVCAAAVGTYLPATRGPVVAQATVLALLFIAAALPSCFVWLAAGAGVQRVLRTARSARLFNVTMGAVLVGSLLLFLR